MAKYIGCDLGGTNMRAGIVDTETGQVTNLISVPTLARDGQDSVMHRMADLFLKVIETSSLKISDIGGVGIGAPGMIDIEKGETVFLPNLHGTWKNAPLATKILEYTGLSTYLLNDVRAITFGEWKFGAGRGASTMAVFAIGTGIGGGMVINNQLHLGIGGSAGELGHTMIDYNGPQCGCGNHGCLEMYASSPAIAAAGLKAVVQGWTTKIGELAGYDLNKITAKTVSQAACLGDPVAMDIYEKVGYYLGIAVSNTILNISPDKIVIGGGGIKAGDLLLDPLRRTVKERVRIIPVDKISIVPAELGDNGGVIGSALWAQLRHEGK
jgi:glucokinase